MNLKPSHKEKLILLVQQAKVKAKDRPEVLEELEDIIEILKNEVNIPLRLNPEDMVYAEELIGEMQEIVSRYVNTIEINDIVELEKAKKDLSVKLMYLSTFKDKFFYEIEYLEEVFKKEMLVKVAEEISIAEGISYTQAEKRAPADATYSAMREQLTELKVKLNNFRTQYDFFSKMVQVIVQSISVATKEHYTSRMNN